MEECSKYVYVHGGVVSGGGIYRLWYRHRKWAWDSWIEVPGNLLEPGVDGESQSSSSLPDSTHALSVIISLLANIPFLVSSPLASLNFHAPDYSSHPGPMSPKDWAASCKGLNQSRALSCLVACQHYCTFSAFGQWHMPPEASFGKHLDCFMSCDASVMSGWAFVVGEKMLILLHNVTLWLDWWFCLPNAPDVVGSVLSCILNLQRSDGPHSIQWMGMRLNEKL